MRRKRVTSSRKKFLNARRRRDCKPHRGQALAEHGALARTGVLAERAHQFPFLVMDPAGGGCAATQAGPVPLVHRLLVPEVGDPVARAAHLQERLQVRDGALLRGRTTRAPTTVRPATQPSSPAV